MKKSVWFAVAVSLTGATVAAASGLSVVDETVGPAGILARADAKAAADGADDAEFLPADLRDGEAFDFNFVQYRGGRKPFQSDHAFDGFVQPFSNPIQFRDPRAMTEARGIFLAAWSDPTMPLGDTTAQVYALQARAAVTERFEVFAAKDGIVRLTPGVGASQTGLANLALGGKYAFYRDPDSQTIASAVLMYEAPTGYANIFQNQGSGLLAAYVVAGREIAENTHAIVQFGQNASMNVLNSGYFLTSAHIDRRFGRFTPFYEANWFYYNQDGQFLPSLGIEGGGLLNLGAGGVMGLSYVTNAVGFWYDLSEWQQLGLGYEFQVSQPVMLFNNFAMCQYVLTY
jgi:hypothetical protein